MQLCTLIITGLNKTPPNIAYIYANVARSPRFSRPQNTVNVNGSGVANSQFYRLSDEAQRSSKKTRSDAVIVPTAGAGPRAQVVS